MYDFSAVPLFQSSSPVIPFSAWSTAAEPAPDGAAGLPDAMANTTLLTTSGAAGAVSGRDVQPGVSAGLSAASILNATIALLVAASSQACPAIIGTAGAPPPPNPRPAAGGGAGACAAAASGGGAEYCWKNASASAPNAAPASPATLTDAIGAASVASNRRMRPSLLPAA